MKKIFCFGKNNWHILLIILFLAPYLAACNKSFANRANEIIKPSSPEIVGLTKHPTGSNSSKTSSATNINNSYSQAIMPKLDGPAQLPRPTNPTTFKKSLAYVKKSDNQEIIYEWPFRETTVKAKLSFKKSLIDYYRQLPKERYPNNSQLKYDYYLNQQVPETLPRDETLDRLINELLMIKAQLKLDQDGFIELIFSFVQNAISFDHNFKSRHPYTGYFHPYLTLFEQRGVCMEKSLLAKALLEKLDIGSAFFFYNQTGSKNDHVAIGLQCTPGQGLDKSNYCYVEQNVYFPIGFIPGVGGYSHGRDLKKSNTSDDYRLKPIIIREAPKQFFYNFNQKTNPLAQSFGVLFYYFNYSLEMALTGQMPMTSTASELSEPATDSALPSLFILKLSG